MGKQHILATNIHRRHCHHHHHHHHHHAFKHLGLTARSFLSTTIPGSRIYDPGSFVLQAGIWYEPAGFSVSPFYEHVVSVPTEIFPQYHDCETTQVPNYYYSYDATNNGIDNHCA